MDIAHTLDLRSSIFLLYSKEYVLSLGGDMRIRIVAILCGSLLVLGACAPRLIPRADTKVPEGFKVCSESPLETAKRFIQGVMDMSIQALRALIPEKADGLPSAIPYLLFILLGFATALSVLPESIKGIMHWHDYPKLRKHRMFT